MKTSHVLKKSACIALSAALLLPAVPAFAADGTTKDETVYVFLNPDGTVTSQTVSSWVHSDGGIRSVREEVALQNIRNVKNAAAPQLDGDVLTWDMDGNDAYYTGTSDKTPPVSAAISYKLDGEEISPQELAGKSGRVEITIALQNNLSRQAIVGGESRTIYTPFIVAGVADLPTDHFSNVTCEGGSVLSEGQNQIVAFVASPGLKESLGHSASLVEDTVGFSMQEQFTIQADATDFELGSIMLGATGELPLEKLKEASSAGEVSEALDSLKSATDQLFDGTSQLADATGLFADKMGQFDQGVAKLGSGAGELKGGTGLLVSGVQELGDKLGLGMGQLREGSAQLSAGSQELLAGVNGYTTQVEGKVGELAEKLDGMGTQLDGVKTQVAADKQALIDGMTQADTEVKVTLGGDMTALGQSIGAYVAAVNADPAATQAEKEAAALMWQQFSQLKTDLESHGKTLQSISTAAQSLGKTVDGVFATVGKEFGDAKTELAATQKALAEYGKKLRDGAKDVSDGAAALQEGVDAGAKDAKDGVGRLQQGAADLNEGAAELQQGAEDARAASSQLAEAADTLRDKTGELNEGMEAYKTTGIDPMCSELGDLTGDLDELLEVKDLLVEQSEAFTSYSGSPEGSEVSTKFLLKTSEIKEKEEAKPVVLATENTQKKGLWERIKGIFVK